jgi:hypothetical protein
MLLDSSIRPSPDVADSIPTSTVVHTPAFSWFSLSLLSSLVNTMQVVVFVVGFHHSHWVITSGAYFLGGCLCTTDIPAPGLNRFNSCDDRGEDDLQPYE